MVRCNGVSPNLNCRLPDCITFGANTAARLDAGVADADRLGILRENDRHNEVLVGHHYGGTRRPNTAPAAMSQAIYAAGVTQAAPVSYDMIAPHIGASPPLGLAEFSSHLHLLLGRLDMSWPIALDNRQASGRAENGRRGRE